ncbi:hypothetical protein [Aestuariibacter salexigens]|uniref:hypothetical protein n=1 Tax=Aestuariibacter salexigens TaxID=226010 RepID=UPI00047C69DC|nr:hypothetical protein [Aestuariibacter salexigens]
MLTTLCAFALLQGCASKPPLVTADVNLVTEVKRADYIAVTPSTPEKNRVINIGNNVFIAHSDYTSARGFTCFLLQKPEDEIQQETRICRDPSGWFEVSKLIRNVDDISL